jgi:hypothetical protein
LFLADIKLRDWGRFFIALTMVFGGLQGLWVVHTAIPKHLFALPGLYMLFYLLNVITGVVITRVVLWNSRLYVWPLAVILLLLQLIRIDGPTFTYALANCTGVWLMVSKVGVNLPYRFASCFLYERITGFGPSIPTGPTSYGVNLFALALLILVVFVWPRGKPEEETAFESLH